MKNKILWILFAVLAIGVGLYPSLYFFIDRKFGLLSTKSTTLLLNVFWNIGFYTHIVLGGISLLIGWVQFSPKLREKNIKIHRIIGKIYMVCVLLSSIAGISIGFFATGGIVASAGFISLGLLWFFSTWNAYSHIKNGDVEKHKKMMVYSYAICFAAVTLRIWLTPLILICNDFTVAYRVVAWLCWIPNLYVAYLINQRNHKE
ncbi:DUF2306 domain-containing protein [Pedobacter fastidiosus]|uniref:DUF2306 domain-containing protein n=1 Tax=Pedobacter fastidiosus TaxID=2765361 RepID=A0ABR7KXN7_9SPHI|nr:DUF2306 domain-containing protein [Pedobacter fastidiosus]MBC6112886.1 DUF2306 domain-containing protein [Pedobacter fastidiosus]